MGEQGNYASGIDVLGNNGTIWVTGVSVAFSAWSFADAAIVETSDHLLVDLADSNGAISAVAIDGQAVPLIPGQHGGLSVEVGDPIQPYTLQYWPFDTIPADWTSARNSDWTAGPSYVTWLPSGGIADSAHLLLGDGVTEGAGMAMTSMIAVTESSVVRISWQAKTATVATTQILNVRIFDQQGQDITSSVNAPGGWGWTSTSLAHGVWGMSPDAADTWQRFEFDYAVAAPARFIQISLRHWTGGDHLLHVDDFHLEVVGGIDWSSACPLTAPTSLEGGSIQQFGELCGLGIQAEQTLTPYPGRLEVALAIEDVSAEFVDRPVRLAWTLPVDFSGGDWWDDIDSSRLVAAGESYSNTFPLNGHAISLYPYCSVTNTEAGIALAAPMNEATVQRFEYDPAAGLRSVWEIGLSPVTSNIGAGRAAVTLSVFSHDAAWGFRAATQRYHELFPEYFVKRTRREGAWMYPVLPSQIPNPQDFGFSFLETWPLTQAEHLDVRQHDIGIFYYVEPWLAWSFWATDPMKPPYDERVATLESWANSPPTLATWQPDGGIGDTGHLLLGDGFTPGAGMATSVAFAVAAGQPARIRWQAKVSDTDTLQILCARVFDTQGVDVTASIPAPPGWFYSSNSQAHVVAGIANSTTNAWEAFQYDYEVASAANLMRVSLRYWNSGEPLVHIDDLEITDAATSTPYWAHAFDIDDAAWSSAHNDDWDGGGPTWLRAPRQQSAQAVAGASPLDAQSRYFIDGSSYLWHEWSPGKWSQAWPVNPDPELPSPSLYDVYLDHWVLPEIAQNDGIYIDSVSLSSNIAFWGNRRTDHLALVSWPPTFSFADGGAEQLAHQAQAKFLTAIAQEVRGRDKLMMLNLFPTAMRFSAHNADIMGSEISQLVESDSWSRLRRALAGKRIVTNLLQWGWDQPIYATNAQMERFIRGQLFWGFHPAVSSAGGLLTGGAPDRYFLHPELYERDRPLFARYMPVISDISSTGWEPITNVSLDAGAEVERFGDFGRGLVYLTIRGQDGGAYSGDATVDLRGCGLASGYWLVEGRDILNDQLLATSVLVNPARLRFGVVLAAGEVGVYRFERLALAAADLDRDGDVDTDDYTFFEGCVSGPLVLPVGTGCESANINADAGADLLDFALLQVCTRGPGVTADPQCAD